LAAVSVFELSVASSARFDTTFTQFEPILALRYRPSRLSRPSRPSILPSFRLSGYLPASMPSRTPLLDDRAFGRTLARMASEIVERSRGTEELVLVGIQRRGVELADRLKRLIDGSEGSNLPCGKLDITLYRDDLQTIGPRPVVGETKLPDLDGKTVVIVDDVLYTGRTVRAALDECADFGRPRRILLCVLIDRGGRELPIQADIVGTSVSTGPSDRVDVFVSELDGRDAVELVRGG
jgi:pyrimidine operon attenuation protein/uracil phosphoribosyltransferase